MSPAATAYPREREAEIVLRDGSTVHVRPIRAGDRAAIRAFLEGVSRTSIGLRFFGAPSIEWATDWSLDVDYDERFALVAATGTPQRIIAHAAYMRSDVERAEVAFLVADEWHGRGIATTLLAHLAEVAELHGITTLTAEVLPHNHRMLDVFRECGFPIAMRFTTDAIAIEMPAALGHEALERFEERERTASVAAVRGFLEPASVAIVGASRREDRVGGAILRNVLLGSYAGELYAVNDRAQLVQAQRSYSSVREIPAPVELAVLAVPAERVLEVARDCAAAGVGGLIVISAGFAESGEEGAGRQRELLAICRDAGMRLIGPNCLGLLNTAPQTALNATFAPHAPPAGRVAFMSQSGGLGVAIIEAAGRLGIGLSSFVSVGNKADLSGNDFLRYWEQDPATDVALMYLESFGDPRTFARTAPRFARRKPLLVMKSGRSAAGARATSSHTGALLSASDVTVDALFEQAGVIRTDTLRELFGVGALLASQPVPKGARVGIVTNAGGPGILCADACQAEGIEVPVLPAAVRAKLATELPAAAALANPLDLVATATAEDYRRALETLIGAGACDAVVAIFVPALVTEARDVAAAIREVAESSSGVPIAAVFMTAEGVPDELSRGSMRVPGYEFPEDAARAVSLAARYGRWRARAPGTVLVPDAIRPAIAAAIISRELAAGVGWLAQASVDALLECYGLPLVASRIAANATQAVLAATELGMPVALKATAEGLRHKSDVGGVRLGLRSAAAVRAAASEMTASLAAAGHALDGFVVQPMVTDGVELLVGVVSDHSFGPVLACGSGGTAAEVTADVAVRITPITDRDATEMLRALKMFPLLDGFRGAPRCDVHAVEDVLLRVSAMVEAHPEIVELDCNPLLVGPDGAVVVDARVRVQAAPPAPPLPSLGVLR